jgi:amino acid transporter
MVRTGFALVAIAFVLELLGFLPGLRTKAIEWASWAVDACGQLEWFLWLVPFLLGATGLGLVLFGARNLAEDRRSFVIAMYASIGLVLILGLVVFFSFTPTCSTHLAPGA